MPAGVVKTLVPRFLVDRLPAAGERVDLPAAEAKHARVRRLRRGERIALFDGAGHSGFGRLATLSRDGATATVEAVLPDGAGESPLDLTLAAAVLKADRFDWVIEKATELGVTRIRPFVSRYSLARPSAARCARWQHIAVSAAKQCGRSVVPDVAAPLEWHQLLRLPAGARLLFCESDAGATLDQFIASMPPSVLAIVGPEGGFTTNEVAAARAAGCHTLSLGPRILRAETAAIAAVVHCQSRWGDLRELATDEHG